MRTKTPSQLADLQTAASYLAIAARKLRDAGEPALALTVLSTKGKTALAQAEAVVSSYSNR